MRAHAPIQPQTIPACADEDQRFGGGGDEGAYLDRRMTTRTSAGMAWPRGSAWLRGRARDDALRAPAFLRAMRRDQDGACVSAVARRAKADARAHLSAEARQREGGSCAE